MNRVNKLAITLAVLVILSAVLFLVGNEKKSSSTLDKALFMVQDTTMMQSVKIESAESSIEVKRQTDQWQLNGQYMADPSLIHLMQTIMSQVQVQRKVSNVNVDDIKKDLLSTGKKIIVEMSSGEPLVYYSGGNVTKTTAYFADENLTNIYVVAIPGYKSYVSGLFELTLNQWRDRVLFSSTWRSLQLLSIQYSNKELKPLKIAFEDRFLAVEGVAEMDTTALMEYLKPIEYFQLNDYLESGSFPQYDSLLQVEPIATLTIEDIDRIKNCKLKIFPKIKGEKFYLVTNESNEMIVVDQGRIEKLLVSSTVFKSQKNE